MDNLDDLSPAEQATLDRVVDLMARRKRNEIDGGEAMAEMNAILFPNGQADIDAMIARSPMPDWMKESDQ